MSLIKGVQNLWKHFLQIMLPSSAMIGVHPLGKYIITFASLLHILWAVLITIDARACKATPVSVLYSLAQGDRVFLVAILLVVAGLALAFLDFRLRQQVHEGILAMLLVPQQFVLWCSAGAGLVAVLNQHYADGVPRNWAHILADQLPVMLMALLYTVALFDVHGTTAKIIVISLEKVGAIGATGAAGATGATGERGARGARGKTGAAGPAGATSTV